MLKYLVALAVLIAMCIGVFFWFKEHGGAADYVHATYFVEGKAVRLSDAGTRYFGNPAHGDLNDDKIPDTAFLFTQSPGGSGTFYYAAVALRNSVGRYVGTNAIFLGDRIAPQSTEIRNGILIVNYADRNPGEPMVAQPSRGVSAYIYYDGEKLIDVPPVGPITIEGTFTCLPHRDTEGPQTTECASGLLDNTGRYFALADSDPQYKNLTGIGANTHITVSGDFKLSFGSKYREIGVITVQSVTK